MCLVANWRSVGAYCDFCRFIGSSVVVDVVVVQGPYLLCNSFVFDFILLCPSSSPVRPALRSYVVSVVADAVLVAAAMDIRHHYLMSLGPNETLDATRKVCSVFACSGSCFAFSWLSGVLLCLLLHVICFSS